MYGPNLYNPCIRRIPTFPSLAVVYREFEWEVHAQIQLKWPDFIPPTIINTFSLGFKTIQIQGIAISQHIEPML